ncbi:flagellar protein FliL [Allopusillimonas ginsengisoli]|nr:flagellar protein FliL [Allopusillimonas ginsengisoli]
MLQSKSSKPMKALRSLLTSTLIAAGSIAATLYFYDSFSIRKASAGESIRAPTVPVMPSPIFAELDPFTVTLNSEYQRRILYVGITLRLADEESARTIKRYMPEVRDRILSLLAQQDPIAVQSADGRQQLVQQLRSRISMPYMPEPTGPSIKDVLFTAFVVQ